MLNSLYVYVVVWQRALQHRNIKLDHMKFLMDVLFYFEDLKIYEFIIYYKREPPSKGISKGRGEGRWGGGESKSVHAWIFLLVCTFDTLDLTSTKMYLFISVKTCKSQESSPFLMISA